MGKVRAHQFTDWFCLITLSELFEKFECLRGRTNEDLPKDVALFNVLPFALWDVFDDMIDRPPFPSAQPIPSLIVILSISW